MKEWDTVAEAAERTGLSPWAIRRHAPIVTVGRRLLEREIA